MTALAVNGPGAAANQLSLLEPQVRVETRPRSQRQAVLNALTAEGIEASEAGAVAHAHTGRHGASERCKWCGVDGRTLLKELAKAKLAVENRGRALWYPVDVAEPQVESGVFPPDFAGMRGEYNAFPIGY